MKLRTRGTGTHKAAFALDTPALSERVVLDQDAFQRLISLERKRTERSRTPFLLMLLDSGSEVLTSSSRKSLQSIVPLLMDATRETDTVGWYSDGAVVGVVFTEIGSDDRNDVVRAMFLRVNTVLQEHLPAEEFNRISISLHVYPEEWDSQSSPRSSNSRLYPDLERREKSLRLRRIAKRSMDVIGSLTVLILGSPIFLLIALTIKLTSRGPVFYRQQRVGQYGVSFAFLKFRSMEDGNDCTVHKEYVRQLIAGVAAKHSANGNGESVYKLTRDPRITRVGAFLRRSSLDELPQFINVLKGDMSLVGPRPPIDYELENYEPWHRRRVLEAKPGITGLWQVNGRNRIAFDEMVRLDLQYARSWSPWLDLKILLRTPKAMIEGAH